jgi:hypothetical protein
LLQSKEEPAFRLPFVQSNAVAVQRRVRRRPSAASVC